ncbi:hypothetical protein [Bradyrhizobium sp.]|uniref:hypothetical protein n=1 Tax=Bradyrhizobium sp. TaxID=376 RepID=UPI0039E713EA
MMKWMALVVIAGLAAGLPRASIAQGARTPDASAGTAIFDARRHSTYIDVARHTPPRDPHYYARPVYYRPYAYGVPVPFVFGYGPWWR